MKARIRGNLAVSGGGEENARRSVEGSFRAGWRVAGAIGQWLGWEKYCFGQTCDLSVKRPLAVTGVREERREKERKTG